MLQRPKTLDSKGEPPRVSEFASGNRTPDPRSTNAPDIGSPLLTQSMRAHLHRHIGTPCTPSAPGACSSGHEPGHFDAEFRGQAAEAVTDGDFERFVEFQEYGQDMLDNMDF